MEYTSDYEDYEDYEDTVVLSEVQVERIRNHAYGEDLPVLTQQQQQQDISEKEQMKNWFDNFVTSYSAAELPNLSICVTDKMVYDYLERQRERSHAVWNKFSLGICPPEWVDILVEPIGYSDSGFPIYPEPLPSPDWFFCVTGDMDYVFDEVTNFGTEVPTPDHGWYDSLTEAQKAYTPES